MHPLQLFLPGFVSFLAYNGGVPKSFLQPPSVQSLHSSLRKRGAQAEALLYRASLQEDKYKHFNSSLRQSFAHTPHQKKKAGKEHQ